MHHDLSLKEMLKEWHGTLRSYVIGFTASFLLTVVSFSLTLFGNLERQMLHLTLGSLALVQAVFQMIYFLHLGKEAKPKWETVIFFLMLTLLLIIVLGSLWVMHDLDIRTMMGGMQRD